MGERFILDAKWGENGELGNQERVGLDYKALPRDLHKGDVLLLNDGLIVLIVERIHGSEIPHHRQDRRRVVEQQGHQPPGRRLVRARADGQGYGRYQGRP